MPEDEGRIERWVTVGAVFRVTVLPGNLDRRAVAGYAVTITNYSVDLELFDLPVKRRKTDVQEPGRFLSVLPRLFQGAQNVLFFELTQSVFQIERESGTGLTARDNRSRKVL